MPTYLTAREAAAELGVTPATLYAYVSRGLLRSEPVAGQRHRLYRAEEVLKLARRAEGDGGAEGALDWGAPVLDSAITLIADGRLFYRGQDAVRLGEVLSLESAAILLWQAETPGGDPFRAPLPPLPPVPADLPPIARCLAALPLLAAQDLAAFNLTPEGVARSGARLLRWLAALAAGAAEAGEPAHLTLARGWGVRGGAADLIRAALVLSADHELNASTFTVRCVASTRASPHLAVLAGLAALQGPLHGGLTVRTAALLPELLGAADMRQAVAERLGRGDDLPGFGHRLYPAGDPRAAALLAMMRRALPGDPVLAAADRLAEAAAALAGLPPSLDFALALLEHRLRLPGGAALGIFAVGRTAGWIAHALEQYRSAQLIRPRARYTGRPP